MYEVSVGSSDTDAPLQVKDIHHTTGKFQIHPSIGHNFLLKREITE